MDEPASRVDVIDALDERDDVDEEIIVTRVQIEQTRAEMSDTIDAIKEKLSPPHLVQEAKESVQEAAANFAHQTVDKAKDTVAGAVDSAREAVGNVVDTAREKVGSAMDSARQAVGPAVESARQAVAPAVESARETGSYLMDTIKQNPMPAALIGLGVGWLYMNQRNRPSAMPRRYDQSAPSSDWPEWSSSASAGQNREDWRGSSSWQSGQDQSSNGPVQSAKAAVSEKLQGVQEQVSQIGARAQQGAGQVADQAQRLFWENPLAVGAMALALGAGLGLAIPQTPQENRLMGDARDQLVDRAQQTAQEIGQKVQAVASEAIDTAKEEARSQGLAPQG